MKILMIGGNKFLRNVITLLPAQVIFTTRKKAISVLHSEKPDGVVIPGPWMEITGAGFDKRTTGNINLHRRIKARVGERVKILRCGYEDMGDEKDFVQIPCFLDEFRKKLRIRMTREN